jgi:hypothetical protein
MPLSKIRQSDRCSLPEGFCDTNEKDATIARFDSFSKADAADNEKVRVE